MLSKMSLLVLLLWALMGVAAFADPQSEVTVNEPELVVLNLGTSQSCAIPGQGYADFNVTEGQASFVVAGGPAVSGSKRVGGRGIQRVSWEPLGDGQTQVTLKLSAEPSYTAINALPGSELKPQTPQVILALGFQAGDLKPVSTVLGGRRHGTDHDGDRYGNYEMPNTMPDYKYSDAMVTLNVRNTDFREVLWLLSEIGNVSIILDPYWADEPTGSRRNPGGGADPGAGGGGEGGGPGFRPKELFDPIAPREGTGNLSLNFENVPFDTALELVVMSVGLVMIDLTESPLE